MSESEIGRPVSDSPELRSPAERDFAEQDTIEHEQIVEHDLLADENEIVRDEQIVDPVEIDEPAPAPLDFQTVDGLPTVVGDRPELAVAKAFAGGLLLAMLLRRLGS